MTTSASLIIDNIRYNIETLNRINAETSPIRTLDLAEVREIGAVARGLIHAWTLVVNHGESLEVRMSNTRTEYAMRDELEDAQYFAHERTVRARTSKQAATV